MYGLVGTRELYLRLIGVLGTCREAGFLREKNKKQQTGVGGLARLTKQ